MIERNYPNLFSPMTVRKTTFRNRVFFSAHNHPQCRAGGVITDEGIAYYEARAKGGAAQVALGETPVDAVHAYKGMLEEHLQINVPMNPDYICQMSKLTRAVQSHGAKISIQLMHAGQGGTDPIGPTGFVREDGKEVVEMDEALMAEVVENFRKSAFMARVCGFDGVQIHGGHGWLLAQFLSPLYNKRSDEYGGSLENRLRFPIRILEAVREALGPDMLIEYRISGDELTEGGLTNEDTCEVCKALEPYVDLFQISAGIYNGTGEGQRRMIPGIYYPHCVNSQLAINIKKCVSKPVIAVGVILTPEEAENLIAEGGVDFVAMARQLIADPEWPNKAMRNKGEDIRPCVRCLGCMAGDFGPPFALRCGVNPTAGFEQWLKDAFPAKAEPQKVVVIGGGPGGMQAALTAAQRGHKVTLLEKKDKLGGTLWFTDNDSFKSDLCRFKNWLIGQLEKYGVDIRLGVEATPETVDAFEPDAVIVAVGASPVVPPIKGIEAAQHALEAYKDEPNVGKRVVFIGGGLVGCETALHLAAAGLEVTVVEMLDRLARDGGGNAPGLFAKFEEYGIKSYVNAKCVEVTENGITVEVGGELKFLEADSVLYAAGMRSNTALADSFADCAYKVVKIGDCDKSAKVQQAVHNGYFAAMSL